MPDLDLPLGAFSHQLSAFRAFALPGEGGRLRFVAPGGYGEPERTRALAVLRALDTRAARGLMDRIEALSQAGPDSLR